MGAVPGLEDLGLAMLNRVIWHDSTLIATGESVLRRSRLTLRGYMEYLDHGTAAGVRSDMGAT
jgi:hypothetical protein